MDVSNNYYRATYWRERISTAKAPVFGQEQKKLLELANLALQEPGLGFWAKRALVQTIRALINQHPNHCTQYILNTGRDWRAFLTKAARPEHFPVQATLVRSLHETMR